MGGEDEGEGLDDAAPMLLFRGEGGETGRRGARMGLVCGLKRGVLVQIAATQAHSSWGAEGKPRIQQHFLLIAEGRANALKQIEASCFASDVI